MYKIKKEEIYKGHFTSPFSRYIMESVIQGYTQAEAYVDDLEHPHITIVWDGKHGMFCGGSADKEVLQNAVQFVNQNILTQQVRMNNVAVKITYENDVWKDVLLSGFGDLNPNVYPRSIYRHRLLQIPEFNCSDSSIAIKRIDKAMLYGGEIQNVQGVIDETAQMWGSSERFLTNAFGYCAIKDGSIAAWCTSEYLSKSSCGIGVETYEPYQRNGVAKAMASKMLNYCKAVGKTPYWDCWKNNTASAKTAERAGFEKLADYEIVFLRFA